jgi:hypothetical protein
MPAHAHTGLRRRSRTRKTRPSVLPTRPRLKVSACALLSCTPPHPRSHTHTHTTPHHTTPGEDAQALYDAFDMDATNFGAVDGSVGLAEDATREGRCMCIDCTPTHPHAHTHHTHTTHTTHTTHQARGRELEREGGRGRWRTCWRGATPTPPPPEAPTATGSCGAAAATTAPTRGAVGVALVQSATKVGVLFRVVCAHSH